MFSANTCKDCYTLCLLIIKIIITTDKIPNIHITYTFSEMYVEHFIGQNIYMGFCTYLIFRSYLIFIFVYSNLYNIGMESIKICFKMLS